MRNTNKRYFASRLKSLLVALIALTLLTNCSKRVSFNLEKPEACPKNFKYDKKAQHRAKMEFRFLRSTLITSLADKHLKRKSLEQWQIYTMMADYYVIRQQIKVCHNG